MGHHPQSYRLNQDIVFVAVRDGTARLLDLQGQFFVLSEVAADMLHDALEMGPDKASESVARRWSVDVKVVKTDLEKLLADLLRRDLLVPTDQPSRSPRLREWLLGVTLAALVRMMCRMRPTLKGKAAALLTLGQLSCRLLGWANTVRLWQRLFPQPEHPLEGLAAKEACEAIDAAVTQALAQSVLYPACKERGLTSWVLARRAGVAPQLVIGLALCPLHAHCWTQVGTTSLGDDGGLSTEYQPIFTYQ
jgi:hypothetical protein